MKIDVNKLLELDYVNDLVSQLNKEIDNLRNSMIQLYDLDILRKMKIEDVNELFSRYNLECNNVLEFLDSSFIDGDWEYADLFMDDISYSLELKEDLEKRATEEILKLNDKITVINDNKLSEINTLEIKLKLILIIQKVLGTDEILKVDVDSLHALILDLEIDEEKKFNLSYEIVKKVIEKNTKIYEDKKTTVDTSEFETMLDSIYESSNYEEEIVEIKNVEPSYSETIIGYYQYYKQLFNQCDLGQTLTQIMNTASGLSKGISSSVNSISKEDFCIELASLLYMLHEEQNKEKSDQEFVADILMDLSILDRIYEDDIKQNDDKKKLLEDIKNELSILVMLDFESVFKNRIKNRLNVLQLELNDNIITTKRKNELVNEYKNIKQDVKKIPEVIKTIGELNELHKNINDMLSSVSSKKKNMASDYYLQLTELNAKVLEMIDYVSQYGKTQELDEKIKFLNNEISKYKLDEPKSEKINLKGFVLFDFDENNQPYVINDLNPNNKNCLIDNGVLLNKINSGYEDYNDLMSDLLIYGTPRILKDQTPYFVDKILDTIFYDKVNRNHPTGMVRIRPLRSSLVRFSAQKIVLHPGTEIYKQVVNMIQEILPNVRIEESEEFSLYINFSSAIKVADVDSYSETINRYSRRSPLYKLLLEHPDKTRLTDEECEMLRDIVNMSLNTYDELEKVNSRLSFDIVKQLGGVKHRG